MAENVGCIAEVVLFMDDIDVTIEAFFQNKIKPSLYSLYYDQACDKWRGPSPRLNGWATVLRRNVAAVASHWRHCIRFDQPEI